MTDKFFQHFDKNSLFLMLMKMGKISIHHSYHSKRKKFPTTCKYRLFNKGRKLFKLGRYQLALLTRARLPQGSYNLIKDSLITSSLASLPSMASLGPLKIHIVPEMEKRLLSSPFYVLLLK